jgi:hypothetical protein
MLDNNDELIVLDRSRNVEMAFDLRNMMVSHKKRSAWWQASDQGVSRIVKRGDSGRVCKVMAWSRPPARISCSAQNLGLWLDSVYFSS